MLPSRVAPFLRVPRRASAGAGPGAEQPERPAATARTPMPATTTRDAPYGLFVGQPPDGMPAMAHVVVARGPQGQAAVALSHIAEEGVVEHRGVRFAWRPGKASALDTGRIADGRDLGFVTVTDAAGTPVVHDTTFAFALDAFDPEATVLTGEGLIRLRDGAPVEG